jgi:hypothetical protein
MRKSFVKNLMPLLILVSILVGLIPVLSFSVSASSNIYVATTGSDSIGDGGYSNPFKSLRKALNVSVTNNYDTIIMRGGTYTWSILTTGITINRSKITIMSYPDETAIIDGSAVTLAGTGASLIRFASTGGTCYNNITVDGLKFQNSNQYACYGIALANFNANITIKNCVFKDIAKNAIYFYSDEAPLKWIWDININNCTFNDIYTAVGSGECISLLGCRDFIFENNVIGNSTKQLLNCGSSWYGRVCDNVFRNIDYYAMKLDPNTHASGGYNPTGSHINIYRNRFVGSGLGMLMLSPEVTNDRLDNISVYDNLIYATALTSTNYGVSMNGHVTNSAGQTFDNISITHNTVYMINGSSSYGLYSIKRSATFTNIAVANNIFVTVTNDQVIFSDLNKADTHLRVMYNCFFKVGGTALGVHFFDDSDYIEPNSMSSDPLFASIATYNFHLNTTSPCIDVGSSSYGVAFDFENLGRPQGGSYDIGTYEYDVEEPIPPLPEPPVTPVTDENQFNGVINLIAGPLCVFAIVFAIIVYCKEHWPL